MNQDLVNQGVILTSTGIALIENASISGTSIKLAQFSVGDGGHDEFNPTFEDLQALTAVPGEWDKRNLTDIYKNPDGNGFIAEGLVPHDKGEGRFCRVAGYWTDDDLLFAVHLIPEWQKPANSGNMLIELPLKAYFGVSDQAEIVLDIDPSLIQATRDYVDREMLVLSESVLSLKGGVLDGGTNTGLRIKSEDGGISSLELHGHSQGASFIYVGQSLSYGGGIEYNGNSNPSTSDSSHDHIVIFRRENGSNHWTARNLRSGSDWQFRGEIFANTDKKVYHEGNKPSLEELNIFKSYNNKPSSDIVRVAETTEFNYFSSDAVAYTVDNSTFLIGDKLIVNRLYPYTGNIQLTFTGSVLVDPKGKASGDNASFNSGSVSVVFCKVNDTHWNMQIINTAGEAKETSIEGSTLVYAGTTTQYKITNYDSFSTYSVLASAGTVTISEDTIYLMVDSSESETNCDLSVIKNGVQTNFDIEIKASGIIQPVILSPSNGAIDLSTSLSVTVSAFESIPSGYDTQLSADWQFATDPAFTNKVHESLNDTTNLDRIDVDGLPQSTLIYCRYRSNSNIVGTSLWSPTISFTTSDNSRAISALGTSPLSEVFFAVTHDDQDNVYAVGHNLGSTYYNLIIAKYDKNNNYIASNSLKTGGNIYVYDAVTDSAGNIFVAGSFYNGGSYRNDAVVYKFNSSLEFIGQKNISTVGSDEAFYCITVDPSGNVYAAGAVDNDSGLICKFDNNLNVTSKKLITGSSRERITGIEYHSDDYLYLCGTYYDTSYENSYGFVAKISHLMSSFKYTAIHDAGTSRILFNDLSLSDSGDIFVVGSTQNTQQGHIVKFNSDLDLVRSITLTGHSSFDSCCINNNNLLCFGFSKPGDGTERNSLIAKCNLDFVGNAITNIYQLGSGGNASILSSTALSNGYVFAAGYAHTLIGQQDGILVSLDDALSIEAGVVPDIAGLSWSLPVVSTTLSSIGTAVNPMLFENYTGGDGVTNLHTPQTLAFTYLKSEY